MQFQGSCLLIDLCYRYDDIYVAPQVKWLLDCVYKNLGVVIEIGTDIDAQRAPELGLRHPQKSLGSLEFSPVEHYR